MCGSVAIGFFFAVGFLYYLAAIVLLMAVSVVTSCDSSCGNSLECFRGRAEQWETSIMICGVSMVVRVEDCGSISNSCSSISFSRRISSECEGE